jgi:hypothetical protein
MRMLKRTDDERNEWYDILVRHNPQCHRKYGIIFVKRESGEDVFAMKKTILVAESSKLRCQGLLERAQ